METTFTSPNSELTPPSELNYIGDYPMRLHQIWLGNAPIPDSYLRYTQEWADLHPGWMMKLWRDADVAPLIEAYNLTKPYNHPALKAASRSDIARYVILLEFGGVYADMDVKPLRPLDSYIYSVPAGKTAFQGAVSGGKECQAVIGACPGSVFLRDIVAAIPARVAEDPTRSAAHLVGPYWLKGFYESPDLHFFEPKVFYPYRPDDPQKDHYNSLGTAELKETFPETCAVHQWAGSWLSKTREKVSVTSVGGQKPNGLVVAWGVGGRIPEKHYGELVQRYAEAYGMGYQSFDMDADFFKAADVVKRAQMVVLLNGSQGHGPLCSRMCERRGIPHAFFEQGMLHQKETFFVDPKGFCGDSVLNGPLHWVMDADREALAQKRAELQARYPLRNEGFVLVPLQVECDSQVLYHSPYVDMNEFIAHVEALYPNQKVVVRPHPKGGKKHKLSRRNTREVFEGDFMDWASRASAVVGITSTCLYEAGVLGVPVVALGDHPLRSHRQAEHDDVLAGALALTVRRDVGDLDAVLSRFGVRPLAL